MQNWRRWATGFVYLAITLILGIGFCVTTVEGLPPHALVVVAGSYYYPATDGLVREICGSDPHAYVVSVQHARLIGTKPNPKYEQQGWFSGEEESTFRYWLECLGLVAKKTRWYPDGTWKW